VRGLLALLALLALLTLRSRTRQLAKWIQLEALPAHGSPRAWSGNRRRGLRAPVWGAIGLRLARAPHTQW